MLGVFVRKSEAPGCYFGVEAGQVGGGELWHIRADEKIGVA